MMNRICGLQPLCSPTQSPFTPGGRQVLDYEFHTLFAAMSRKTPQQPQSTELRPNREKGNSQVRPHDLKQITPSQ